MKRWQIALILIVILGLIGGLELNIYLRHHPQVVKKMRLAPRVLRKQTFKKTNAVRNTIAHAAMATKKQYSVIAHKGTKLMQHGLIGKIAVGAGSVVLVVLVAGGVIMLMRRQPRVKKPRVAIPRKPMVLSDDDDLPPLTKHADPEVNGSKMAEVLKARRDVGRRDGKLSPMGEKQIKKYEITEQVVNHEGRTLRRVRALTRMQTIDGSTVVEIGELGGYIENEANLSHYRNAWVGEQAYVYGNAKVYGDAVVAGQAKVFDMARIYDMARVDGVTIVGGTAEICGKAHVSRGTYAEGKIS